MRRAGQLPGPPAPRLGPKGPLLQFLDGDGGVGDGGVGLGGVEGNHRARPGIDQYSGRQGHHIAGGADCGRALAARDGGAVVLEFQAHRAGRTAVGTHSIVGDAVHPRIHQGEVTGTGGVGNGGALLHLVGVEGGGVAVTAQRLGAHIGGAQSI